MNLDFDRLTMAEYGLNIVHMTYVPIFSIMFGSVKPAGLSFHMTFFCSYPSLQKELRQNSTVSYCVNQFTLHARVIHSLDTSKMLARFEILPCD